MAETRARFLANTIGATSASNDFTLPDGVGTENQVISSNGAGGTTWANTLSAPTITSVTGTLNVYEDGVSEDGGVLTINGTSLGNDASALSVQISGTTGFAVIAETTTISITSSGTQFTATFTGAETNYNHSSFAAGSTIYVKVTKSGLLSSTYATLGTAMTGDPSFSTTSTTASTHTGTLATTSLGSYGGQIAGGGQDSNTKLLLNFDRAGGTDIEDSSNKSDDGHKVTANGNAVIKASPFGDGKSAIRFDAVDGTEVKVASFNTGTGLGAGAFTLETWIWCEEHNSDSANPIIIDTRTGSNGFGLEMIKTSGQLFIWDSVANSKIITESANTLLPLKTWTHVAIVRTATGTPVKLYLNGKEAGASSNNSSDYDSETLTFGRAYNANGSNFKGYQDEIRVVVGTAVYTGDFTPRTSRLDSSAEASTTKLLISGGKTSAQVTSDSSINTTASTSNDYGYQIGPGTLSVTGAVHSTSHGGIAPAMAFPASLKKTGSAGVYFEGTDDKLTIPHSTDFGYTASFTWDFFVNFSSVQTCRLIDKYNADKGYFIDFHSSNGLIYGWYPQGTGTSANTRVTKAWSPNANTWYHVCVSRSGYSGDVYMYIDGTSIGNGNANDGATTQSGQNTGTGDLHFGAYGTTNEVHGYMDHIRYSSADETASGGSLYNDGNAGIKVPTKIYGAYQPQDVGTIQLNATAGTGGGALDYAELSGGTALSTYGLSLSSSGAITGTLTGLADNSNSGGVIRIRARANADDDRVTTLGGSSFTGITQNDGKAPVVFNARRYTGNALAREISGYGFRPDLIWVKNRDATSGHMLVDSVRGLSGTGGGALLSNTNDSADGIERIDGFTSDGWTHKAGTYTYSSTNNNAYMAWAWKAGGAPTATNNNTSGAMDDNSVSVNGALQTSYTPSGSPSIYPKKMSVNTVGGFSIINYTPNGTAGATLPHGLSSAPEMIIVKDISAANNWIVYHTSIGATKYLILDDNSTGGTNVNRWNNTAPSNSVVTLGVSGHVNGPGTEYIMYCFHSVSGASAFGTYNGSSSGGSVTGLGFKPRLVIGKRTNGANNWWMFDRFRESGDALTEIIKPDDPDNEFTYSNWTLTVTNDGFTTGNFAAIGESSGTYIYMAFA